MERPATLVGLSEVEAASRLRVESPNELRRPTRRRFTQIVFEILSEPMIQLLLGASAIYFALGDIGEALMLAGSAVVTVVVAIVQESRTERTLEALRDLSSPRALVIRDGTSRRIPGREVVFWALAPIAMPRRFQRGSWTRRGGYCFPSARCSNSIRHAEHSADTNSGTQKPKV